MSDPRLIHTVSRGYVKRFAVNGQVMVTHARQGLRRRGVGSVCVHQDYWGPPAVSKAVEASCGVCESIAIRMLRKLPELWPIEGEGSGRAELAQFLAIHTIRTPVFRQFVRTIGERILRDESRLTPSERVAAAQWMRDPVHHANMLLGQITRIANMLSSMHWSIVRFERDMLITGDQPVLILPTGPGNLSPASSVPAFGLANSMEVTFTLDPQHLLLLTWKDARDSVTMLEGTEAQAASVNCALRAVSLEEWLYKPGARPPFLTPPLLEPNVYAISTELLPGYDAAVARQSERHRAAEALLTGITEENMPRDRMRWVRVSEAA